MNVRTKSGRVLEPADVDRIAEKADAGVDLRDWRPVRGRPPLDNHVGGHAPRIAVRVPQALREAVEARAAAEGQSLSQAVRSLLEDYARGRVRTTVTRSPKSGPTGS